jgi:zinc transporter
LTAPSPGLQDEFLWLHFSRSNVASEPWLRRYLALPDAFYELLHTNVGSTRLEQDADALVALIHDVLFDFTFDASADCDYDCLYKAARADKRASPAITLG